jgi:hypothetical protein
MNIGAARKSSIVSISNSQLKFLLKLLYETGIEQHMGIGQNIKKYDINNMPQRAKILNDAFLSKILKPYIDTGETQVKLESILYAYFTGALKNPKSVFHEKIIRDLEAINPQVKFPEISQNVMLDMIPSLHIQEEIDILLCDSDEKNFLIFEMKNGPIANMDIEQAEKYIQLIKQRFTKANVYANIVGANNPELSSTDSVKLVAYTIEETNGFTGITLKENKPSAVKSINLETFL